MRSYHWVWEKTRLHRWHQSISDVLHPVLPTKTQTFHQPTGLVVWHSGNAFHPINEVTLRKAGLVLRRAVAYGQVNHLSM